MSHLIVFAASAITLALSSCHSRNSEPPPPPATFELAVAPPGARGARAAGTDAAPPAPSEGELNEPGTADPEPEPEPDPDPDPDDAGAAAQGGGHAAPTPGVAL